MIFALAAPVLLGITGLAVDSASFSNQKSRMQSVADSTALAVAKELHIYHNKPSQLQEVGKARAEVMLAAVGIAARKHTVEVGVNPAVNLIDVTIAMATDPFLPVEVWGESPIRVTSQAHAFGQSKLCILGLHASKSDTIKVDDGALLTAPECAVQSNSSDPSGLNVKDDSRIVSTLICTSGGAKGGRDSYEPAPTEDCPPLDDPLEAREPPPVGGCTFTDLVISQSQMLTGDSVFCGGLKIEKNAVVTLSPGIYVITGGKLEVKDHAQLVGDHVNFYFADDAAVLDFDEDTTIDLSAPADGLMAGILFYGSRLAVTGRDFTIKSENARRLLGTIYLPKGTLKIEAEGNVAEESAYTVIVAEQIEVKEANLVINSDYGGTDVPVPEGVGPHSSMVMLSR